MLDSEDSAGAREPQEGDLVTSAGREWLELAGDSRCRLGEFIWGLPISGAWNGIQHPLGLMGRYH